MDDEECQYTIEFFHTNDKLNLSQVELEEISISCLHSDEGSVYDSEEDRKELERSKKRKAAAKQKRTPKTNKKTNKTYIMDSPSRRCCQSWWSFIHACQVYVKVLQILYFSSTLSKSVYLNLVSYS
jgi:hypothetical protein